MRAALALALVLLAGPAAAAPSAVRLSFVGDPSTSMAVSWNAPAGTAEARVELWRRKGDRPVEVRARLRAWGSDQSIAEAVLRDLQPATLYRYRVGDDAGGFSPEYSFRTAPPSRPDCGRFRFVVVGDSRSGSPDPHKGASRAWPALATRAASHLPAFILHDGDIVRSGHDRAQWRDHLEVSSPLSALVPILYALGNHDTGPGAGERANFNRVLQLPRSSRALGGSGTEDYYAFRYGNALFVVLSTESFTEGSSPMLDQARWMDRVFGETPARWRFVVLHRPIYTGAPRLLGHRPNEVRQNAALLPVLNKHHVDIVFAGHNHFYERFAPSACTDAASSTPCPVASPARGTVFITTGGAGAATIPFCGATGAARPAASSKRHYVLCEIADHALRLEARDAAGARIDELRLSKAASARPCSSSSGGAALP